MLKKEEVVDVMVKKLEDDEGSIEEVLEEEEGDLEDLLGLFGLGWIESVDFLDLHMRREMEILNGWNQDLSVVAESKRKASSFGRRQQKWNRRLRWGRLR